MLRKLGKNNVNPTSLVHFLTVLEYSELAYDVTPSISITRVICCSHSRTFHCDAHA